MNRFFAEVLLRVTKLLTKQIHELEKNEHRINVRTWIKYASHRRYLGAANRVS